MVPAAVVDSTLDALLPKLEPGDVVIDGGNSYYRDDIARAARLATSRDALCRLRHERRCVRNGSRLLPDDRRRKREIVARLDPNFATLAPGDRRDSANGGP